MLPPAATRMAPMQEPRPAAMHRHRVMWLQHTYKAVIYRDGVILDVRLLICCVTCILRRRKTSRNACVIARTAYNIMLPGQLCLHIRLPRLSLAAQVCSPIPRKGAAGRIPGTHLPQPPALAADPACRAPPGSSARPVPARTQPRQACSARIGKKSGAFVSCHVSDSNQRTAHNHSTQPVARTENAEPTRCD